MFRYICPNGHWRCFNDVLAAGEHYHCFGCGRPWANNNWILDADPQERDPLLTEREKTHGDFKVTATASQALKNALRDWDTKGLKAPQKEALEMICMKMARILQHPEVKDSWLDIAGYAKLGSEACDG